MKNYKLRDKNTSSVLESNFKWYGVKKNKNQKLGDNQYTLENNNIIKIDDIKTIGIIYIDAKLEITVAFTILVIGNKKRNNPNMPISHNICKNS